MACFLTGCSASTRPIGRTQVTIGDKNFVVIGGGVSDRTGVVGDLRDIFSTARGKVILAELESRRFLWIFRREFTIDLTARSAAYTHPFDNTIYVDPRFHPTIQTTAGPLPASTLRIIAHELGHAAFGTLDDGPANMNNVIQNENPIVNALGGPARTRY